MIIKIKRLLFGFLSKLSRFSRTEFFKAFSTSSLTTGIQMITGLVVNKIIAVTIGPSGLALLGQFINFKSLLTNIASGSFQSGVTKYVADSDYAAEKVIATSNIFSLILSLIIGLCVVIFSPKLSVYLLKDVQYSIIFLVFGLLLPFFSLNSILHGTVNGFRNYKALAFIKITNNGVGLIVSVSLLLTMHLKGALLAYAINTSIVFVVSIMILNYYKLLSQMLSFDLKRFNVPILKKLLAFTLMALTSTQLKPFVQLYIRDYIMLNGSEYDAGIWQAMISLSSYYLLVITTALGVYYLPKLASLKKDAELRKEIFSGIKKIMPLYLLLAVAVYFTKHWIIILLFANDFLAMKPLFLPQLIGDFFMMFSFIIAYMLLAKAMVKVFIISQVFFSLTRIVFSITLFDQFGVIGVFYAHALNYFLYSVFVVFVFRKLLFVSQK